MLCEGGPSTHRGRLIPTGVPLVCMHGTDGVLRRMGTEAVPPPLPKDLCIGEFLPRTLHRCSRGQCVGHLLLKFRLNPSV